jgi:hypothetical protein
MSCSGHERQFGCSPAISGPPPIGDMRTLAVGRKRTRRLYRQGLLMPKAEPMGFWIFFKLNFLPANQGDRSAGKALRDLTTPYRISRRFF